MSADQTHRGGMADIKATKDAPQAPSVSKEFKLLELSAADRRRSGLNLLRQFDEAPLQPLHVKAAIVSGVGFVAEGFARFMVQILGPMLAFGIYPKLMMLPDDRYVQITWVGVVGLVSGRFVFGVLGDRVGRQTVFGWTTILMAFTLAFAACTSFGSASTIMTLILLWGTATATAFGGQYATASVITSEYAPRRYRGGLIAFSYSMQLLGYIFATCTTLIVTRALKPAVSKCLPTQDCNAINNLWRVCLALGGIPGLVTFYACSFLPETPRFLVHVVQPRLARLTATKIVPSDPTEPTILSAPLPPSSSPDTVSSPPADMSPLKRVAAYVHRLRTDPPADSVVGYLLQWAHLRPILAMTTAWFLSEFLLTIHYLVATPPMSEAIGIMPSPMEAMLQPHGFLWKVIWSNNVTVAVIYLASAPGYIIAILGIHYWGRRKLMVAGFLAIALFQALLGIQLQHAASNHRLFVALYVISVIAFKAGPGTINIVIPAECFPTRFRCTLYGLILGVGHIGNIVGFYAYREAVRPRGGWQPWVLMYTIVAVGLLGALVTMWVPEPGVRSLESAEELGGGDGSLKGSRRRPKAAVKGPAFVSTEGIHARESKEDKRRVSGAADDGATGASSSGPSSPSGSPMVEDNADFLMGAMMDDSNVTHKGRSVVRDEGARRERVKVRAKRHGGEGRRAEEV